MFVTISFAASGKFNLSFIANKLFVLYDFYRIIGRNIVRIIRDISALVLVALIIWFARHAQN